MDNGVSPRPPPVYTGRGGRWFPHGVPTLRAALSDSSETRLPKVHVDCTLLGSTVKVQKFPRDAEESEVNEVLEVLVVLQSRPVDSMFACSAVCTESCCLQGPAGRRSGSGSQPSGCTKSLRYPSLPGGPLRADPRTTTGATIRWRII